MDGQGVVTLGSHSQALDQPPSYSKAVQSSQQGKVQPEQPREEGVQSQPTLTPQLAVASDSPTSSEHTQHAAEDASQLSTQSGQNPGHGASSQQMWIFQPIVAVSLPQIATGSTTYLPYSVNYYGVCMKNINHYV